MKAISPDTVHTASLEGTSVPAYWNSVVISGYLVSHSKAMVVSRKEKSCRDLVNDCHSVPCSLSGHYSSSVIADL